ncbi:MAG TPA: protein kinase, partial [Candidatus Hydrogenedentes bacterium]|nr:protein kinase [Candidatus Hydrogenedentota bacterium]
MLEPETPFGKYRILRLLGRGGMGVVYLAEDTTLGRKVALKVLDQAITSDRRFAERFREEARLIATLEHPRIVGIHALEQVDGIWCIDM